MWEEKRSVDRIILREILEGDRENAQSSIEDQVIGSGRGQICNDCGMAQPLGPRLCTFHLSFVIIVTYISYHNCFFYHSPRIAKDRKA